jgi:MFS family permease
VGITLGLFPALLSVNLELRGIDTSVNGLLAAMHGAAGLIAGLFVPRMMARVGSVRLYFWSVAFAAGMALFFAASDSLSSWFVIRFVMGLGLGTQWIVSETLMSQIAQGPRRGTIISLYVVMLSIGMAIGPLLLTLIGTTGLRPFVTVSGLLLLSSIPIIFLRLPGGTKAEHGKTLGLLPSFLRCPSAMLAGAADGFVFQAFMALLPVYFLRLGTSEVAAIGMLNAFCVGAVAMQVVIGQMLDRFSPDKVIIGASLLLCVGLALVANRYLGEVTLWVVVALMGGPAAALFTAGLAGVNDKFSAEEMSSGTSAFTVVWHVGGLSGPALVGVAMDMWEPYGFPLMIGMALVLLVIANGRALWPRTRDG